MVDLMRGTMIGQTRQSQQWSWKYSQIDYILYELNRAISTLLPGGNGEIKPPRSSGQALAWSIS
jgi:hypothetical protein